MERKIYASIEEMTRPEVLSSLLEQPITRTCLKSFETAGFSSTESEFLAVDDCHIEQPRYIIKRLRKERDWAMQATEDHGWRTISMWQQGLLDLLPTGINHGTIACSKDEEGYAVLMHNLSHILLPDDVLLSEEDHVFILDSLAAFHASFWEDDLLQNPKLNLCRLEDFFSDMSTNKIERIATTLDMFVLDMILEGRRLLPQIIDSDIADFLNSLANDPAPLCAALAPYPKTLVHNDFRRPNLAIERGNQPQLFMFDWARTMASVPAIDLVYYLYFSSTERVPFSHERSIELYKERLVAHLGERFDESWWLPQLELSLLSVLAEAGFYTAWFAQYAENEADRKRERATLEWWAEQANRGVKWLAL